MRYVIGTIVLGIAALAMIGDAVAAGHLWRNHAAPYDFLFENEIDTHQQTRAKADGVLVGFLYVHYTGERATDGLPIAQHADCARTTCDVGWTVDGLPASATFLYQVADDHPVWLVERADIPQPGAYSHFHWLGSAPLASGDTKFGYFFELRAIARFCFLHHDMGPAGDGSCGARGGVAVIPGIDIATHLNIVASFPGVRATFAR
jgi:hypothetical protein